MILRRVHPLAKLAVAMVWLVAVTFVFDPRYQATAIAAMLGALIALDRASPLKLALVAIPFALFGLGFLWINLFFHDQAGSVTESYRAISWSADPGLQAGWVLFLRALAYGFISYAFVRTTDAVLLVRALQQYLNLPASVAYGLFAAIQFWPRLLADIRQILTAHAQREGRPPPRLPSPRQIARLVIPVLAGAVRRATRSAQAMEARGLRAGAPRTHYTSVPFAARDGVFVAIAASLPFLALIPLF